MLTNDLALRMKLRLAALERRSQRRELRVVRGVSLCSNDYLGLSVDPRLKEAVTSAISRCDRVGSTGSRLLSGHDAGWDQLEEQFAAYAGTEASLFFNSGYAANVGLLSSLMEREDVVFSDALNHASIIDGIRLSRAQTVIYRHLDLNNLEVSLRRFGNHGGARVIVTESIFSADGDRAPLVEIFDLANRYRADVIVDEAHATGVYGPQGHGLAAESGLKPFAVIHTCGKALASVGAFVCGTRMLKSFLINHARSFIFSTALPPYLKEQIGAALRLVATMDREREHLVSLSALLRERFGSLACALRPSGSHIVPLIVGGNKAALNLAASLEEEGFAVRAIRPPAVPQGTSRLRLSLTARLTKADVERFVRVVSSTPGLALQYV